MNNFLSKFCSTIKSPTPILLRNYTCNLLIILLFSVFLPNVSGSTLLPDKVGSSRNKQLRTIIVDNYFPYTFVNENGQPDGYSVELIKACAKVMGVELEIRVDVWEKARNGLLGGEIDFLPMMAYSETRDKDFDFSSPHTISFDAFFIRKKSAEIKSINDLRGKKIIVMKNDQAHDYLNSLDFISNDQLIFIHNLKDALRLLSSGEGDAALMPKLVGLVVLEQLKLTNLELAPIIVEDYNRPFSIAVKEGNQELLERLSQGINILKKTKQYRAIYNKWFGPYESAEIHITDVLKYFFWIILIFALVGAALLLWSLTLKRQVAIRTKNLADEIAERKIAESRLKDSEEQLRKNNSLLNSIIEGTTDAIFLKDLQGRYLLANPATCQALGKEEEEILGKDDKELFPSESVKVISEVDSSVIKSGETRLVEERLSTAYGDTYWLANKSPFVDQAGNIIGLIGISRNITEFKNAEKHIRESHERLLTVFDSLESVVYVADMDTYEILYANQYATKKFGDIAGKICWQVVQKDQTGPCDFCTNDQLLTADGEPTGSCVWEFRNTLNGRWYFMHDSAIKWIDDRYVRMEIATDITEKKKAEEEKHELESRLRQAQKMESIGTLAGGIAHDFNNILSAILGYTEIARESLPPKSSIVADLDQVCKAGNRAKELVKQILAFSRHSEQELKPIQIHLIVKEALKLLRASIPTTIEIRQNIDPKSGFVLVDPTQIHQITMNLCTNAYHAMRETGGVLTIAMHSVWIEKDDHKVKSFDLIPGSYIELEISDSGVGMDRKIIDKIFDPYFTTKEKGEGTGLGLSMVHGIVKSYGGHITVFSERGKGTAFRLYLPRMGSDIRSEKVETVNVYPTGNERSLVVDDEKIIVDMLKRMLTSLGYEVTATTSSSEALEIFQQKPDAFDFVFTDMTMPNMNGSELIQRIRTIRPNVPIILCTGFSELIDKEKALNLGASKYLMKPIVKRDLAAAVRGVLDESASSAL